MLQAIVLYLLVSWTAAESLIRCNGTGAVKLISEGEVVRFTSPGYPLAITEPGQTVSECEQKFIAPENRSIVLSFVNGYTSVFGRIHLIGVYGSESGNVTFWLNTARSVYVYYQLGDSLTVSVERNHLLQWNGFEATLSLIPVPWCQKNLMINLTNAEGPLNFGTVWMNSTDSSIAVSQECSWIIYPMSTTSTTKIVAKKISLREGESLTIVHSNNQTTSISENNGLYFLPSQVPLKVVYRRNGSESDQYGVLLEASAFEPNEPTNAGCQNLTNGVITLNGEDDLKREYEIKNTPSLDSFYSGNYSPYPNNQICNWSFQAAPNNELRIHLRTLKSESCCDHLYMKIANNVTDLSKTSENLFVIERNTNLQVDFGWSSDGNIALTGFKATLEAFPCTCGNTTVILTKQQRSKHLRFTLCRNIDCEYTITAPTGYALVSQLYLLGLENATGERITISDGTSVLFYQEGLTEIELDPGILLFSSTSMIKLRYQTGNIDRDGEFSAMFKAFKERREETRLSEDQPSAFRSSKDILTWTVTGSNNLHLYIAGGYVSESINEEIKIYNGTENGTRIATNLVQLIDNRSGYRVNGNMITIVIADIHETSADNFIYVADYGFMDECSGNPFFITSPKTPFTAQSTTNDVCYLTLIIAQRFYENFYYFLRITNVDVELGTSLEPIRLAGGQPSKKEFQDAEILSYSSDSYAKAWNYTELNGRIFTFQLHPGDILSGTAVVGESTDFRIISVGLPSTGIITSPSYGIPNYQITNEHSYSLHSSNFRTVFKVNVVSNFDENTTLIVDIYNANQTISGSGRKNETFTVMSSMFAFRYRPSANGEKGFVLSFTAEENTGNEPGGVSTNNAKWTLHFTSIFVVNYLINYS